MISGYMDIWIYGYMDIWIYEYMDTWIHGYMVLWIYGYTETLAATSCVLSVVRYMSFCI